MLKIRWHGRAGQGAVTGSKGLAKVFFLAGKEVQAFAFYGSAKRGAAMTAFNRIADQKIINHERAMVPDYVFVIDEGLITADEIMGSTTKDTKFLLSSGKSKDEILEAQPKLKDRDVYVVDCIKIARETIGRPIPNTPILGAFMKLYPEVDFDYFKEIMKTKVLNTFPEDIIEKNMLSIDRAYGEVH